MAATAAMIAELRRIVAEPTADTYSDDQLATYIERYPLLDELGQEPYTWDYSTQPPTEDANALWIPTYDLYAAAVHVWEEKASLQVGNYDFSADGGSYSRSQHYQMCMKQARHCAARRQPGTIRQVVEPRRLPADLYPLNAREVD